MTHDHITRRSFLATFVAGGAALALASCFDSNSGTSKSSSDEGDSGAQAKEILTKPLDNGYDTGVHHATIEVKGLGTIKLELNATNTPITVSNFARLANAGFYDGLTFHRVIKGFMIQGGGFEPGMQQKPTNDPIKNEADNGLKNDKYTIAMARTNDPHSATAQFFINVADNDFLNHTAPTGNGWGYAVFGKVVAGRDVVDQIARVRTGTRGWFGDVPVEDVVIEKAEEI